MSANFSFEALGSSTAVPAATSAVCDLSPDALDDSAVSDVAVSAAGFSASDPVDGPDHHSAPCLCGWGFGGSHGGQRNDLHASELFRCDRGRP